jgi:hypothetical protein
LGDNNPLFNIGTRNNGSDGTIDIYIRGGGPTVGHIFSTAEPFDDEWHHVVFVQDDLSRSIYVDGVLDDLAIAAKPESGWDNLNATTIGGILRGSASHWVTGLIDEVAIWKRALSGEETALLHSDGMPGPPVTEDGLNLEGPTIVDFGDLSGDASYEFFFKAIKAGASTAIAGNNAFALKLDQWNEQGVFGTTVFGVADNVFTPVEGKSVASVFDRDVHVVAVNDTAAGETRLYVDGDHVGVLAGNFELAGEGKVMGARTTANTDPMGEGSVMHWWATYNSALTDAQIAALAAAAGGVTPEAPTLSIVNNGDGTVTVTFEGKLQAAASVNGPWADVNESSPLTIEASEAMQYARAVNE